MTSLGVAIAIHVLSVVWWIGGLAFVTAVILPDLRSGKLGDTRAAFEAIESRFEPQVRIAVLLAGLSGLYLLFRLDLWRGFSQPRFWWLDAMVLFWLLFMVLLFVISPAGLLERSGRDGGGDSRVWRRMHRLHALLLVIALIIIGGAAAGSHGF
ncbi:MAG TPA: hypothetical protein VGN43_01965 [Steroidobacteraceae bacterium]|jgi:uncharacterized membrane protein|nr:hypothetical protein [Steroidobacteraceae bacterium]